MGVDTYITTAMEVIYKIGLYLGRRIWGHMAESKEELKSLLMKVKE